MLDATEPIIQEMVRVIVSAIHPEQVILFGSRATGSEQVDSDVDLLIVEPEPFGKHRSRKKEMVKLYDLLSVFSLPKDILVFSKEEVEFWKPAVNHVIHHALKEGRILYERD